MMFKGYTGNQLTAMVKIIIVLSVTQYRTKLKQSKSCKGSDFSVCFDEINKFFSPCKIFNNKVSEMC